MDTTIQRLSGALALLLLLAACHRPPAGAVPADAPPVAPAEAVVAAPVEPAPQAPAAVASPLVRIGRGIYRPIFPGKDGPKAVAVAAFAIEEHAVTNEQFRAFVVAEPAWRRSRIRRLFADPSYLARWRDDLTPPAGGERRPVTGVSWFAARAYAEWIGRRLPTLAEWEYVAAASATAAYGRDQPGFTQRILAWYEQPPRALPVAAETGANFHGVRGLHGVIWEWVEDFNTALVTGESRGDSGLDRNLFCAAGSVGSADPSDYAAFMRFAFRGSLKASYTLQNLGFRCAADIAEAGR